MQKIQSGCYCSNKKQSVHRSLGSSQVQGMRVYKISCDICKDKHPNSIKPVYKIDTPITMTMLMSGFCKEALLPHSEYSLMNII